MTYTSIPPLSQRFHELVSITEIMLAPFKDLRDYVNRFCFGCLLKSLIFKVSIFHYQMLTNFQRR